MNARRIEIVQRYKKALPSGINLVESPIDYVAHLCVIQCKRRDELSRFLNKNGVQSAVHYPIADFDQEGWKNLPKALAPNGVNITKRACSDVLSLPCYPSLTDQSVDLVAGLINNWDKNK